MKPLQSGGLWFYDCTGFIHAQQELGFTQDRLRLPRHLRADEWMDVHVNLQVCLVLSFN